ncbi:MAG: FeoA family protein [Campylobacterota bacterium]|nr:FeoA family protein [Campylobacterota bacterium]
MKTIISCERGHSFHITKIHAHGALKERLMSLGFIKGVELTLLEYAPGKSTVEIKVGKMRIALRKEEAELIEVNCEKY